MEQERRADYNTIPAIAEDVAEIKASVSTLTTGLQTLTDAVVGTSDERQLGILPRVRDLERFAKTYRYVILAVMVSFLGTVLSKLFGAW